MIYESRLELARLLLADYDTTVRHVIAQPFLLRARVNRRIRRHVPDFLLFTNTVPTASITAAAAALGIQKGVLQHQINRLAIDLGGALFTRAQRNHPRATTSPGRRVLRAWHKWTEEIEAAARSS